MTKEPARGANLYAMKTAHDNGRLVSFDVNYRDTLWESEAAYHGVDQAWLGGQKEKMGRLMGDDAVFVRAGHAENRRFRVREYR